MSLLKKFTGLLQSVYGIVTDGTFTGSGRAGFWGYGSGGQGLGAISGVYLFGSGIRLPGGAGLQFCTASFGSSILTTLSSATTGVLTTSGTIRGAVVTPAQITANQDNYAPTAGGRNYRLSTDASRDITGLSISQVDGQECFFLNVGAQNIVLKHDVTSTAANRFLCAGSADITLTPNDIARLVYDSTSARWRVGKL